MRKGQVVMFVKDRGRYIGVGQVGTFGEIIEIQSDGIVLVAVKAPGQEIEELYFHRDEFIVRDNK